MIVAFFDFDGTITKKDTLIDFAVYSKGKKALVKALIINIQFVIGYKLGVVSGQKLKEKILKILFKGYSKKTLETIGRAYCKNRLPKILRTKALTKIRWHQQQNHRVIVVTASAYSWVKPFCDDLKIELIATELVFNKEVFTGKIFHKNCIGIEKVNRIKEYLDTHKIVHSYAYGNSKGDHEMLAFVSEKHYKCF